MTTAGAAMAMDSGNAIAAVAAQNFRMKVIDVSWGGTREEMIRTAKDVMLL
jgi:hypothetical protein